MANNIELLKYIEIMFDKRKINYSGIKHYILEKKFFHPDAYIDKQIRILTKLFIIKIAINAKSTKN